MALYYLDTSAAFKLLAAQEHAEAFLAFYREHRTDNLHSLRTRIIEHYRQPFDRILGSDEARAVLGGPDPDFAVAQLLGPVLFLRLPGMRPVTPADCERIVDDFIAARGPR